MGRESLQKTREGVDYALSHVNRGFSSLKNISKNMVTDGSLISFHNVYKKNKTITIFNYSSFSNVLKKRALNFRCFKRRFTKLHKGSSNFTFFFD